MQLHQEVSRLRKTSRYLTPLVGLLMFTLTAYGQRGSITGTIADSSGAVAPNATVEVKNTETGAVFSSGTSSTGNYVVPVPAGTYSVTVSSSGFKKYVRQNVVVQTATDTRLDVSLELGAITE